MARARGVDIRAVGSGNIGATNVARALGKGWAVLVLVGRRAEGIPAGVRRPPSAAGTSARAVALAGLAAMVGHMFTIFCAGTAARAWPRRWAWRWVCRPAGPVCFAVYCAAYAVTRLSRWDRCWECGRSGGARHALARRESPPHSSRFRW